DVGEGDQVPEPAPERLLVARWDDQIDLRDVVARPEQLGRPLPDRAAVERDERLLFLPAESGRLARGRDDNGDAGHGSASTAGRIGLRSAERGRLRGLFYQPLPRPEQLLPA